MIRHAPTPRYLPPQAAIKAAEKEDVARAKEEGKKKEEMAKVRGRRRGRGRVRVGLGLGVGFGFAFAYKKWYEMAKACTSATIPTSY